MEDYRIIELYNKRDERAISETSLKYYSYCFAIAKNILPSREDCEECVNDTWLRVWNSIPPEKPDSLKAYLARITRNLSIDRYRENTSVGRGGGELALAFEELDDFVADTSSPSSELEGEELATFISSFLRSLPQRDRRVFVLRYFYMDSTESIASACGLKESYVLVLLSRTRKKLREALKKGGYSI